ncbi:MAG: MFS transporter [Candidatus Gracilibacteria bacterium]
MWIYSVGALIAFTFINIYVFKIHNSFKDIIFYNMVFFTSIFIGFSILGLIMSIFSKNIKNMYYVAYFLFILSFICLFIFNGNLIGAYVFGSLYGLGNGSFRNAVHTQELKNIMNKNRDFYSSSISVGTNILSILTPLIIAFIFYICNKINFDGYTIIFLILPLLYSVSFLFINDIDSYIPNKITKVDFKNFFNFKKYKYGHLYFLIGGLIYSLEIILLPIISIILLKNEINIGLFQGILTIISTYLIIHLSHKRKEETRLKYFFIICVLQFVNFIFIGTFFNLISFIIFSLVSLFLNPIYRVSEHVYDLTLMDSIKTKNNDFYPAMLMREFVLWIGSMSGLTTLLILINFTKFDTEKFLKIGLIYNGFSFIFLMFCIYLWEKYEKNI